MVYRESDESKILQICLKERKKTYIDQNLVTLADSLIQLPPAYMKIGLAEAPDKTPGRIAFVGLDTKAWVPTTKQVTVKATPKVNVMVASTLLNFSLNSASVNLDGSGHDDVSTVSRTASVAKSTSASLGRGSGVSEGTKTESKFFNRTRQSGS